MKYALVALLVVVVAVVVCARIARLLSPPPPRRPRGWLDDDGVKRGPCWDGSWFSGPRATSVPA
jgi:hypothetical protein